MDGTEHEWLEEFDPGHHAINIVELSASEANKEAWMKNPVETYGKWVIPGIGAFSMWAFANSENFPLAILAAFFTGFILSLVRRMGPPPPFPPETKPDG